jgi:hypothetical protein
LLVDIGMNIARLQSDVGKATRLFGDGMKKMSDQVGFLKSSLAGLVSVGSLVSLGKSAIMMGSELQDASEKFGVSASELMKLQVVAKMSGVDMAGVGNAIKFMSKAIADAVDPTSNQAFALKAIGVSLKDLQGKSPIDQFMALADAFKQLEKDENYTRAALALFGKAGTDIIPVLSKGSEEIKKMSAEFVRLGAILSDKDIAKLDDYGDAIDLLGTRLKATAGKMIVDWGAASDWMLRRNKESLDLVLKLNEAYYDLKVTMGLIAPSVKTGKISSIMGPSPEEEAKKKAGSIAAMEEAEKARKKAEEEAEKARIKAEEEGYKRKLKLLGDYGDALALFYGDATETSKILSDIDIARGEKAIKLEKERLAYAEDLKGTMDAMSLAYDPEMDLAAGMENIGNIVKEVSPQIQKMMDEWYQRTQALADLYATVFRGKDGVIADMANVAIGAFHGMTDALTDFVMTGKANFRDFANSVIADIMRIMIRAYVLQPLVGGLMGAFGFAVPVTPRAGGGPVYGGSPYLVGERGPELFVPSSSGNIIPGGKGGNVTVNVQNNTGSQVKVNKSVSFDTQGMVIDMVIDGLTRNVHGLRTALGGA